MIYKTVFLERRKPFPSSPMTKLRIYVEEYKIAVEGYKIAVDGRLQGVPQNMPHLVFYKLSSS